jgi:Uncharacterized conserved protein (DUF2290)
MTTPRALHTHLVNALDSLSEGDCLLYANSVAIRGNIVSWQPTTARPFALSSSPASPADYLDWVISGHYSAILPDASLLQMTYELYEGEVVKHRLAYVPCPVLIDEELLLEEPVGDVVEMYLDEAGIPALALRSPLRFDFDLSAASVDHPAAHLTLNADDCRIACVAPLHPYRFLDFVYRHFYPDLRAGHDEWFDAAQRSLMGRRVLADDHRGTPHVMWDLHPSLISAA